MAQDRRRGEERPLVLYYVLYLGTKSQTYTLSLSFSHTPKHTYNVTKLIWSLSSLTSVRVTAIYSVPSISADYT